MKHPHCLFAIIATGSLLVCPSATRSESSPLPAEAEKQGLLSTELRGRIDKAAEEILAKTGVPSISIAVVKDGELAYAKAYGMAIVEKHTPATTTMRYSVGSVSKQFTATAILLLAEEGKLSLDDPVGRWLPDLTRAKEVTLRQILSMTSGYQDFWPQDYVMPSMMKPTSPDQILAGWARKQLDFEPGTKWQYSNTNYVIAGLIVERIAGMPLFKFLQERVFKPLGMESVFNTDTAALPDGDPMRYLRYGLGPVRPAPKEGKGWLFAAGELAMTASDLAKWDVAMIDQKLLQPSSYQELEKAQLLKDDASTQYGLGVGVSLSNGRRLIAHNGEVSGFTANNSVYPDERAAVIVLTNLDATRASMNLSNKIASLLFLPAGGDGPLSEATEILTRLQEGKIDRTRFTENANAYFSEQALKDLAKSLGPLGKPTGFSEVTEGKRGGMTFHRYRAEFRNTNLTVSTYAIPDGKLEQYIVASED